MDSPQEPLISPDQRDDGRFEFADDDATDTASDVSKVGEAQPGLFVVLLTLAAGISGLLFGCMLQDHILLARG